MWSQFFQGISCVRKGIKDFYSRKKWWKYALFPLLQTFVIYILMLVLLVFLTVSLFEKIRGCFSFLPEWLNGLAYGLEAVLLLGTVCVFLLIIFNTISTLYEMCGGLFLDQLIESYDNEQFACSPPKQNYRQTGCFIFHLFVYSINTSILSIILLIQSLFFPMLGQIALLLFIGYRYGLSLVSAICNYHGMSWRQICVWSNRNTGLILGFGITCYVILLIPFAILFVLPGITLGSVLLYHESRKALPDKEEKY